MLVARTRVRRGFTQTLAYLLEPNYTVTLAEVFWLIIGLTWLLDDHCEDNCKNSMLAQFSCLNKQICKMMRLAFFFFFQDLRLIMRCQMCLKKYLQMVYLYISLCFINTTVIYLIICLIYIYRPNVIYLT